MGLGFGPSLFLDLFFFCARGASSEGYTRSSVAFKVAWCLLLVLFVCSNINYSSRLDLLVIYITISKPRSHHTSKIAARIAARNLAPTLTLRLNVFLDARQRT